MGLILSAVLAGLAASFAVVLPVFAQSDAMLSHAEKAKAVALAAVLGHFTLPATELYLADGHGKTVAPGPVEMEVPLVTQYGRAQYGCFAKSGKPILKGWGETRKGRTGRPIDHLKNCVLG